MSTFILYLFLKELIIIIKNIRIVYIYEFLLILSLLEIEKVSGLYKISVRHI